jgi:hypothetical protein
MDRTISLMNAPHVKDVSLMLVIYGDMSELIQGNDHMNAQYVKDDSH